MNAKNVQIIARFQFKDDARKVVYKVRASNGVDTYETSLFAGHVTGCTCESRKPCYHMTQLEEKEATRVVKVLVRPLDEMSIEELNDLRKEGTRKQKELSRVATANYTAALKKLREVPLAEKPIQNASRAFSLLKV